MIFYISTDSLRKGDGAKVTVTDTLVFEGTEEDVVAAKQMLVRFLAPPVQKWYVPREFVGTVLFPLDVEHWSSLVANRPDWFGIEEDLTLEATLNLREEVSEYDDENGAEGTDGNWGLWQEAWATLPEGLRLELISYVLPIEAQLMLMEHFNASG